MASSFFAIIPFKREEPLAISDDFEAALKIIENFRIEGIRTYVMEMTEIELIHYVLTDIIDNDVFDYSRKDFEDYGL